MVRFPPIVPPPIVVMELEVKSVVVVISSCFVPISVMILVVPTTKSPVIVVSVFIFTSALNIVGCSVMVVFVIVGSSYLMVFVMCYHHQKTLMYMY